MQHWLRYWYILSPSWAYRRFTQTIQAFDGHLAVADTWRNITKPIFQDYSYQGRIIGFFLRLFRIFFSLLFYCLIALFYLVAYAIWLLFPVICVAAILRYFL